MTNQEILEKAFMIATNNGFRQRAEEPDVFMIPEAFIYRHDFAKALWGDKQNEFDEIISYNYKTGKARRINSYEKHLQQMVISDDPIKYIGGHI